MPGLRMSLDVLTVYRKLSGCTVVVNFRAD